MRALLLLSLATPAFAQDLSSRIPPRSVVELRTRGLIVSKVTGRLTDIDSGSVTLEVTKAGTTATLPWSDVEGVRWTRGRSHRRGLVDGAFVGTVMGVAFFVNSYPYNMSDSPRRTERIRQLRSTALGIGATIAALGLAVGSASWSGAPIPRTSDRRIALTFTPHDEVRVESTLGRVFGRNAIAGDSLRLTTTIGPATFAWKNVGDLQVRAGKNRWRGILYGAGAAYMATSIADAFARVSGASYGANVALGAAAGYRFLSPVGWTSLPQPRQ